MSLYDPRLLGPNLTEVQFPTIFTPRSGHHVLLVDNPGSPVNRSVKECDLHEYARYLNPRVSLTSEDYVLKLDWELNQSEGVTMVIPFDLRDCVIEISGFLTVPFKVHIKTNSSTGIGGIESAYYDIQYGSKNPISLSVQSEVGQNGSLYLHFQPGSANDYTFYVTEFKIFNYHGSDIDNVTVSRSNNSLGYNVNPRMINGVITDFSVPNGVIEVRNLKSETGQILSSNSKVLFQLGIGFDLASIPAFMATFNKAMAILPSKGGSGTNISYLLDDTTSSWSSSTGKFNGTDIKFGEYFGDLVIPKIPRDIPTGGAKIVWDKCNAKRAGSHISVSNTSNYPLQIEFNPSGSPYEWVTYSSLPANCKIEFDLALGSGLDYCAPDPNTMSYTYLG